MNAPFEAPRYDFDIDIGDRCYLGQDGPYDMYYWIHHHRDSFILVSAEKTEIISLAKYEDSEILPANSPLEEADARYRHHYLGETGLDGIPENFPYETEAQD